MFPEAVFGLRISGWVQVTRFFVYGKGGRGSVNSCLVLAAVHGPGLSYCIIFFLYIAAIVHKARVVLVRTQLTTASKNRPGRGFRRVD